MSKPIEITLIANSKGVIAGAKDSADALDKVGDSLDDIAADAAATSRKVESGLDGVQAEAKETDRSVDRLEATFRELATSAKRSTDDIERNTKQNFDGAGRAVDGFKDEAKQNFAEVASSFDGSMQGIADGVQGTLGGLATSVSGPAGIALAAVGAVAGGVLQAVVSSAEQQKQKVEDAFQDMIASGNNYVSQAYYSKAIQDIEDSSVAMGKASDAAKDLGLSQGTVVAAFAGVPDAAKKVTAAIDEQIAKVKERSATTPQQIADKRTEILALQDWQAQIESGTSSIDGATTKLNTYNDAMALIPDNAKDAASSVDSLGNSVNSLPSRKAIDLVVNSPDWAALVKAGQNYVDRNPIRITGTLAGRFGVGQL